MSKTPEAAEPKKKKGNAVWAPLRDQLSLSKKDPDTHYRWVDTKNEIKNEQRLERGYFYVNKTTTSQIPEKHPGVDKVAKDASDITGAKRVGELALMGLPMEIKEARDEYYQEETRKSTAGIKRNLQKDLDKTGLGMKADGRIVIE